MTKTLLPLLGRKKARKRRGNGDISVVYGGRREGQSEERGEETIRGRGEGRDDVSDVFYERKGKSRIATRKENWRKRCKESNKEKIYNFFEEERKQDKKWSIGER